MNRHLLSRHLSDGEFARSFHRDCGINVSREPLATRIDAAVAIMAREGWIKFAQTCKPDSKEAFHWGPAVSAYTKAFVIGSDTSCQIEDSRVEMIDFATRLAER